MGIILLPLLLAAAILSLICLIRVIRWMSKGELGWREILIGIGICTVSYMLVAFSFYLEGTMNALAPFFRLLFVMFYVPFIVSQVLKNSAQGRTLLLVKATMLSIFLAGLLATAFYQRFFEFGGLLNIPVTH